MKQNCWEFKNCGRQVGGNKAADLGVCPASTTTKLNNVHEGKNSGRSCWVVTGTYCKGEVQGTYAKKNENCSKCDFYLLVKQEEANKFQPSILLLNKLNN